MPQNSGIDVQSYGVLTQDGHSSRISVYRSGGEPFSPVVICFPAMGVPAEFYGRFARKLARSGVTAVTADLRGIGCSSVRASRTRDFGYFEMVHFDWPAVVEKVRGLFPRNPVFLLGHSLGGQLSALYLSLQEARRFTGLILITGNSVYFRGYPFPDSLRVLAGTQAAYAVSRVLGYFPGRRLGFGGVEARSVIRDWSRQSLTGRYRILKSDLDYEALLGKIPLPVVSFSFEDDFLAPASSARHLLGKLKNAAVTHIHLNPRAYGIQRRPHFAWAKQPDFLIPMIREWMASAEPDRGA